MDVRKRTAAAVGSTVLVLGGGRIAAAAHSSGSG
jgi:hypothetical protein